MNGDAGPGPSQQKRKATFEAAMSSSPARPQPSGSQGLFGPTASQLLAGEEEEDIPPQEEITDELYCSYVTDVVGVRYYQGEYCGHSLCQHLSH